MKANKYIFAAAMACGAVALPGCDENSWNDKLEGFEGITDAPITVVESVEFTLAEADYSTIAGLAANKELAGDDGAAALAAVGTLKCFSAEAPASVYVPAWLETTSFPYYTLNDGSSVRLTYRVATDAPEYFADAAEPQTFTVDADMYHDEVWGGDDWVDCFVPSRPAADYIPSLLADYADANDGMMCVVSYRQSQQEPVFGAGEAPAPTPVEVFAQSFTEALEPFTTQNVSLPEELDYVWSWGGVNYGAKASAFKDKSYPSEAWLISPEIDLTGYTEPVLAFEHVVNKFPDLDFAKANCTLWVRTGATAAWEQVTIPQYTDNTSWTFGTSGDINLAAYEGKKIQLGFKYVSEEDKSGTWEVKNLTLNAIPASRGAASRAQYFVPSETRNALYLYTDDSWQPAPKSFTVLSPADYTAMGQSYPNLSAAEPYLSKYLDLNMPYAAEGDIETVVWNRYAGGSAAYTASAYIYDGSAWAPYDFITTETAQFVRAQGKWMFDPNVTITLPAGRNEPLSTLYFQTCTDWVYENICVPMGDTSIKSGLFYVTSYGNNEYYSGTSAYQGNVDLRPQAARDQYPAGYEGMSDDEIIELEKTRFMNEVMPGALAILHPDAAPLPGFEVLYTINFSAYFADRTTRPFTAIFRVAAKGTFEPVSCTWWDEE
ncbi:MAG: choice-of-anchor J domain-containing protein [Muribaculaceae bacterium]|nr:choice-of-anchor J domain-containing protein [Muribaculaceae bacterium]